MRDFYKGKRVLITGNTGFKGSWLTMLLSRWGAELYGYSLAPPTKPSMFEICNLEDKIDWYEGNILDFENIKKTIESVQPEIVFHLAAQPLVGESYEKPVETFNTNIMGTVYLLDAIRQNKSVKALVNVTTDKCYSNKEGFYGYREDSELGGHDPYSSSKACSELITASFKKSFFSDARNLGVATARAGNVIGGGDFAKDRLIPDCIRAIGLGHKIELRDPMAVRPWQHVLEPLQGYLKLAMYLYEDAGLYSGAWNFGPHHGNEMSVFEVVNRLSQHMDFEFETGEALVKKYHETHYLKLDSYKATKLLKYQPVLSMHETIKLTAEWYKKYWDANVDLRKFTEEQIDLYESKCFGEVK
ncbi:CDP-glucose 4,6-dehydratase [Fusibacter sp. 3D3]|uniref:CDP-glucose 4,6-dehydratase n=1 Tax=Fusibacter sp. 3D3 TaxID=1048380 RepID=UPI0008573EDB|nr:CDP-glucose 4,6-dehydratase [Fusibacter sp. 3D3]GAU75649.1 similar to CDP-glucose 4,6-dehydratase [Fusibacter sp. 3D3]